MANVTIPFTGQIVDMLSRFDDIISALGNILVTLYIIGLVLNGFLIVSSLSGFVFKPRKFSMLANIFISVFAAGWQTGIAVITIVLVLVVGGIIGMLGRNLGIRVDYGSKALAFILLSAVFTTGAGTYCFATSTKTLLTIINRRRKEKSSRREKLEKEGDMT